MDSRNNNAKPKIKKARRSSPLFVIPFVLFAAIFILAAGLIIKRVVDDMQDEKAFHDLAAKADQAEDAAKIDGLLGLIGTLPESQPSTGDLPDTTPPETDLPSTVTPDTVAPDTVAPDTTAADTVPDDTIAPETPTSPYTKYAALYAENNDFVGWLHVDHTSIDYPVMCTPNEPEYYLRRAFDRTYSVSGSLFVNKDCTIDSDFYIIHGHNMKTSTVMFGTLDKYAEKAFWETTPTFTLTTLTEQREYEIFAALESRVLYRDETGYRYYYQIGDLTEDGYDELVSFFKQKALYDTGITPTYGEQIVVLSTCSDYDDNVRFIVAARRIDNAG